MAAIRALWLVMTSSLMLRGGDCGGGDYVAYDEPSQDYAERIAALENINSLLASQLLHQQQSFEEKNRGFGGSGLVKSRVVNDGPKTYYADQGSISAIHDHSNFVRTMGMGEIQAVLNGVDFRTRHNDYSLFMPSTTSSQYHAVEDVPFPEVPPEVTAKGSVEEQIVEMRKWFKAWRDSDYSVRDYRPYFKPVLCYLEGAWTTDSQSEITEPFYSTRHVIDATSWEDFHQKALFESSSRITYDFENMAQLPTKLYRGTDGRLALAQWNYRFMCHPIQTNVEKKHLTAIDELGYRLSRRRSWSAFEDSRGVRFLLNDGEEDSFYADSNLLDKIMAEIPGKDNYLADIEDSSQGYTMYSVVNSDEKLNVGYYHRFFNEDNTDVQRRGYGDRNLFVAETTQENVMPVSETLCDTDEASGEEVCREVTKRLSYATPWEIVWLHPLHSWNPYGLVFKGDHDSDEGKTVTANRRNGQLTSPKAYNGTNSHRYFQTPAHFFTGGDLSSDVSESIDGVRGVLDADGNVHQVLASGLRFFVPSIAGVGSLRTRYPVLALHEEGSPIWKELEAVRDVLTDLDAKRDYLVNIPLALNDTFHQLVTTEPLVMLMPSAESESAGFHHHVVYLSPQKRVALEGGDRVIIRSLPDQEHTHSHELVLKIVKGSVKIISCDSRHRCSHDHGKFLIDSQE